MKRVHWCVIALLSCAIAALDAQTLRGKVTEASSSSAVPGVVILVIDSAGEVVSRGLSGGEGEFVIAVGRPGSVRVRTLRLGFRPTETPPFSLRPGEDRSVALSVTGVAARLETVLTTASTECGHIDSDSSAPATRVLEQIRTALYATDLTARRAFSQALNVRMIEIDRLLDPETGAVVRQEERIRQGLTISPWSSLPPQAVRDSGYVRNDPSGMSTFFAPDLGVLVSPQFVEDHCFRTAGGADGRTIRLEFEPVRRRRRLPEIRGAMIVDVHSSELRRLEFTYVNLPSRLRSEGAGGQLTFVRAPGDLWLISGWSIRLPVIETRRVEVVRARMSRTETRVVTTGHRETGAELALVTRGRDTVHAAVPMTLAGRVVDSTGRGIPQARVLLRGTGISTRTDTSGAFATDGVLPGSYVMEVRTPEQEPWGVHTRPVTMTRSDSSYRIVLPAQQSLLLTACGENASGAIGGKVALADSTPVSQVRVSLSWPAGEVIASRDTVTDLQGFYRFCSVPFGTTVTIATLTANASASERRTELSPGQPIGRVDLVIDTAASAKAMLHGRVLDAATGAPVANAAVSLVRSGNVTVTDVGGRYRLSRAEPGTDSVRIRRLGFRIAQVPVRLVGGQSVERNMALERVVTLDTVKVRESQLPSSFYEHQRLGLGQFLTRAEIEKQDGRRLSDVLSASFRGVQLVRYTGNQTGLESSRGPRSLMNQKCFTLEGTVKTVCGCFPAIYLDRAAIFDGRTGGEIPDINLFSLMSIEAIEFYSGASQIPAIYNNLDAACGVLVIHTRR